MSSAEQASQVRPTLLLAIETSSRQGSVVLHDGSAVLGGRSFAHGLQNAALLLPLIDELCRELGCGPNDISDVAVSVGPGSFTGLRIGVTLAKTLAFATGARLLAVPSLPVIAMNAPDDARYVMSVLDARRGQVFAAVYACRKLHENGNHAKVLDELIGAQLTPLPDLLAKAPRPLLILGEGVRYHMEHLDAAISDPASEVCIAPEPLWYPDAATVAHLAQQLKRQNAFADPYTLTPLYLRKPEAQERMEAGLLKHLE